MHNRVRLLRKHLNLTQENMAGKLGIGKSALSMIETGKAALSERNKKILIQEFGVNPDWLENGEGAMLNPLPSIRTFYSQNDDHLPAQYIPLYTLEGIQGLTDLFSGENPPQPKDFIHIPNMPRCDGALYIYGDSMYPLLQSGDIVLYKMVTDHTDILWGDMYLLSMTIDGDEFITVRYVHKSEKKGVIRLVSNNEAYEDKDIPISRLLALALVKASIRLNTII